jgi:hypothetical protein
MNDSSREIMANNEKPDIEKPNKHKFTFTMVMSGTDEQDP